MKSIFKAFWLMIITLAFVSAAGARPAMKCADLFEPSLLQRTILFQKALAAYTIGPQRVRSALDPNQPVLKQRLREAANFLYNGPLQIVSPLPLNSLIRWETPVNDVFMKLWRNPGYQPTEADVRLLTANGAEGKFAERQAFLRDHRRWHLFQLTLRRSYKALKTLSFSLFSIFAVESVSHAMTAQEFVNQESPSVELLIETTPFPHTALRIDRRVYSYGVSNLSISTVSEYMLGGKKTKLTKALPRSVQVIDLNVPNSEKEALIRYLEAQRGKTYRNVTFVNDCSSMIARALSSQTSFKIPEIVDASPAAVIAYMTALQLSGDSRVGSFSQIVPNPDKPLEILARNAWINSVDSRIWMANLIVNYPYRVFMDLKFKPSDLQFHDSTEKKIIADFYSEVRTSIDGSYEIQGLREQIRASNLPTNEARHLVEQTITLLREPYEQALANPRTDLVGRTRAEYALQILKETETQFLTEIESKKEKS